MKKSKDDQIKDQAVPPRHHHLGRRLSCQADMAKGVGGGPSTLGHTHKLPSRDIGARVVLRGSATGGSYQHGAAVFNKWRAVQVGSHTVGSELMKGSRICEWSCQVCLGVISSEVEQSMDCEDLHKAGSTVLVIWLLDPVELICMFR